MHNVTHTKCTLLGRMTDRDNNELLQLLLSSHQASGEWLGCHSL